MYAQAVFGKKISLMMIEDISMVKYAFDQKIIAFLSNKSTALYCK